MKCHTLAAAALALMVSLLGCEPPPTGGEETTEALDGVPSCSAGLMRLEGVVAGASVTFTENAQGGFGTEAAGGDLETNQEAPGSKFYDPGIFDVRLTWAGALEVGTSVPAQGTVRLPNKWMGSLAGRQLCSGADTRVELGTGQIAFVIKGLRQGPDCSQPVVGTLRGCYGFQ